MRRTGGGVSLKRKASSGNVDICVDGKGDFIIFMIFRMFGTAFLVIIAIIII